MNRNITQTRPPITSKVGHGLNAISNETHIALALLESLPFFTMIKESLSPLPRAFPPRRRRFGFGRSCLFPVHLCTARTKRRLGYIERSDVERRIVLGRPLIYLRSPLCLGFRAGKRPLTAKSDDVSKGALLLRPFFIVPSKNNKGAKFRRETFSSEYSE